ncbi:hypothetical protein BLNAU_8908 [Blattamonas nauphoetae]|uniref:Endoplasmic reticulum resident protein 29 C-terminal domain-containing protein n=1 Tax=Blattamonas nauphoetae TaxID=2049346 RepID=A0ABQ9XXD3_9EUKA|nr:hypothetical protein BLNAU_8908 [Blattamonas nauphoetae]
MIKFILVTLSLASLRQVEEVTKDTLQTFLDGGNCFLLILDPNNYRSKSGKFMFEAVSQVYPDDNIAFKLGTYLYENGDDTFGNITGVEQPLVRYYSSSNEYTTLPRINEFDDILKWIADTLHIPRISLQANYTAEQLQFNTLFDAVFEPDTNVLLAATNRFYVASEIVPANFQQIKGALKSDDPIKLYTFDRLPWKELTNRFGGTGETQLIFFPARDPGTPCNPQSKDENGTNFWKQTTDIREKCGKPISVSNGQIFGATVLDWIADQTGFYRTISGGVQAQAGVVEKMKEPLKALGKCLNSSDDCSKLIDTAVTESKAIVAYSLKNEYQQIIREITEKGREWGQKEADRLTKILLNHKLKDQKREELTKRKNIISMML